MPTITLYHASFSPPSRAALMCARVLDLDVNVKRLNLLEGENRTPEYLQINPQHTVPALVDDDGFVLWDSHAIACYLANRYGKDDSLYPRDPKKRALVDQRLYFEAATMFPRAKDIGFPVLALGANTYSEEGKAAVYEALDLLEGFLAPTGWVAGDCLTIADCSCVAAVTSIDAMGFNLSKYSNISAWVERCSKAIPRFQEDNQAGVEYVRKFFKERLLPGQI